MKPVILALASATLLALTACGDADSGPTKKVDVRQPDTSKQAPAPGTKTDAMKMQEGQAPAKP